MTLTTDQQAVIDKSAAKWRELGTDRLTQILLRAPASVSPEIDKFSSWLLGGTAATIVLMVTNAERILDVLAAGDLQVSLVLLLASGVCGGLAKMHALFTSLRAGIHSEVNRTGPPLLDELERDSEPLRRIAAEHGHPYESDPDVAVAVGRFIEAFPRWWHFALRRHTAKSKIDPFLEDRKVTRGVFFQSLWTSLQVLGYACFVAWIVFALGKLSWS